MKTWDLSRNKLPGFFLLLSIMIYVFWQALQEPGFVRILDDFNLLIHEAGHWIFAFAGRFMTILGGTLMQLIVPATFIVYFFKEKDITGLLFSVFWWGQNLVKISIYAADAVDRSLPLLGGDTSGHDWHNIFTMLGVLEHTGFIAGTMKFVGFTIMIGCLIVLLFIIFKAFVFSENDDGGSITPPHQPDIIQS